MIFGALRACGLLPLTFAVLVSCAQATIGDSAMPPRAGANPPAPHAAVLPGRGVPLQYGVNFLAYWSGENALINDLARNSATDLRARSANWDAPAPQLDAAALFERGHIDARGRILSIPPGGNYFVDYGIARQLHAPNKTAEVWVVDWTGGGDNARIGVNILAGEGVKAFAGVVKRVGPRRIEVSFPPRSPHHMLISVSDTDGAAIERIRAYPKSDEAAQASGRIFSSDFINRISPYAVIRTMDWALVNSSLINRTSQIADASDAFWATSASLYSPFVSAAPLAMMARLGVESGKEVWFNAPPMLGAPDALVMQTPGGSPRALAEQYASEIRDSAEIDRWAEQLVRALDEAGYPADRKVYVELGNEIWNWAGPFSVSTAYYWGLSTAMLGPEPAGAMRYAYGYQSARLAHAMEKALKAAGVTRNWTLVIGAHTLNPDTLAVALKGAGKYLDEVRRQPLKSRIGAAATSYWQGVFNAETWRADQNMFQLTDRDVLDARIREEISSDPEGFAGRIADWLIHGTGQSCIPNLMARQRDHARIIRAWGGVFVGNYEGGSHDDLNIRGIEQYAAQWNAGPHRARVTEAMARAFHNEFPDALLANYVGQGRPTPGGPWVDHAPGEVTPESLMWEAIGLGRDTSEAVK